MNTFNRISKLIIALADPNRLRILRLVLQSPGITTAEILKKLNITASTLTFHIKKLVNTDTLYTKKKGSFLTYYPNLEHFKHFTEMFEKGIDDSIVQFITHEKFAFFNINDIIEILTTLADPTRLKIIMLIASNPGITGKDLHIQTNESEADISFHTKLLEKNKCICSKKISNQVYYWVDIGFFITFYRFLNDHRKSHSGKSIFNKK